MANIIERIVNINLSHRYWRMIATTTKKRKKKKMKKEKKETRKKNILSLGAQLFNTFL